MRRMTSGEGDRLVEAFFAFPNQLGLEDLEDRPGRTAEAALRLFRQLVDDARTGDGRPILLPRVDDQGTQWYALISDPHLRRVIAEDIKAFVGATYCDLSQLSAPLDPNDPIDQAARRWLGDEGVPLRFRVPPSQRSAAIGAIVSLRRAWDERPRHLIRTPDGTAVMLRVLNRAIATGDSALAETVLDRVRSSGRLSSANITFSTIRVLEVSDRWSEMLDLEEIGVLLAIPRPRAVTQALLRAVYWTELADHLPTGETPDAETLNTAFAAMSGVVLPRYGALFRAVDGLKAREALLLFALRAAVADPPRGEEIERLAEGLEDDDPAQSLIASVRRHIESTSEVGLLPSPESAFASESVKAEIRRAATAQRKRIAEAQSALEAFARGPSTETASAALAALHVLDPEEAKDMETAHRYQRAATRARGLIPPGETALPDGWVQWSHGLRTAPNWPGASDILEVAADSWPIDPLLDGVVAEDFALTLMDARSQGGRDATARSLDHLVPSAEVAVGSGLDVTALGGRLITVLLADDVVTEADWTFVVGLLDAVLDGIGRRGYVEILDELSSSLADRASPAIIDASLAVLEMAAFHPAPDPEALSALATVVIGNCRRFTHRLHRDQLAILDIACKDIGEDYARQVSELAERVFETAESPTANEQASLSGQLIGVYTLEEPAAMRAKTAIESAYPGVRVETNASHVATQALRRLAQTADQMVIATRAAKHAATLEIDLILRKRDLRPIFPAGKGATSIIRALRDRVSAT
jgi:hypothetical protein